MTKKIRYQNYDIKLVNHPRAKHIRLSVSEKGEIKLTKPNYVRFTDIKKFLSKHDDWLDRIMKKISVSNNRLLKINEETNLSISGEVFSFKIYKIDISRTQKVKINHEEKVIYIFKHKHNSNTSEKEIIEKLKTQLKKYSKGIFQEKSLYWANQMNTRFNKISVRSQKTRWGSCSTAGNLNYNWKLILAPPEVLEYVVVHEIAHLIEHNHSHRFWSLVERNYPDFKQAKSWLKKHGNKLNILD